MSHDKPHHEASGSLALTPASQAFLDWNRSQAKPLVEICFEIHVFEQALRIAREHGLSTPTAELQRCLTCKAILDLSGKCPNNWHHEIKAGTTGTNAAPFTLTTVQSAGGQRDAKDVTISHWVERALAAEGAIERIKARRCTNPKPVGDSACECCTHHWVAIERSEPLFSPEVVAWAYKAVADYHGSGIPFDAMTKPMQGAIKAAKTVVRLSATPSTIAPTVRESERG